MRCSIDDGKKRGGWFSGITERVGKEGEQKDANGNRATLPKDLPPTVGVEFATKIVIHPSGARIKAQIWDTAGQERFASLAPMYYRGAAAAIVRCPNPSAHACN